MFRKLWALGAALLLLAGCAGPETWRPKPYLELNGEAVEDPSPEKLREGILALDGTEESYVYVELAQPLSGVWYLYAALPLTGYDDGMGYFLEACAEDGAGGYRYLQSRTSSEEEVLSLLDGFYRGEAAPDLTGWEDITQWYMDSDPYYYDGYDYGHGYDYGYDYGYGENSAAPV